VVAQGAANPAAVGGTYTDLISAVFPFMKGLKKEEEKKMIERMQKEVAKGAIMFKPIVQSSPFQDRVKKMSLPDETMAKLRSAAKKRGK
jgi:hypothetical protein